MRSKKFIPSCSSFSVVNFMGGCKLLNSLSLCSMFVFCRILCEYHQRIWNMRLFVVILGFDICVYVPCAVCMFQLIMMMLGHPWLTRRFVYSIVGHTGSRFVPSLLAVCVLFLRIFMWISKLLSSILLIIFIVSLFGILVYMFSISKEHSHTSMKFDGL
jgi:hypothetical protein